MEYQRYALGSPWTLAGVKQILAKNSDGKEWKEDKGMRKYNEAAQPLTRDSAIIDTSTIAVRLLAQQLKSLVPFIALYDRLISELFDSRPDSALFNNLPGAGKQLATFRG